MGGCGGRNAKTPEALISHQIDTEIKEDQQKGQKTFKVLLLGTGDSGKSTFIKQIHLICNKEFSDLDFRTGKRVVQDSLIMNIKTLAYAFTHDERFATCEEDIQSLAKFVTTETELYHPKWTEAINTLWKHPVVLDIFSRKLELCLATDTNAKYFLDAADRILASEYTPTTDDLLHVRLKTTGVREQEFANPNEKLTVKIIDVGGQRSERRKWLNHFDNVDLIVYFSAVDGYAMRMAEFDANRFDDDIRLFKSLMDLVGTKNWLFLQNKVDLFPDVLKKRPMNLSFPEIPADKATDPDYCLQFLANMFSSAWTGEAKLDIKRTCALDTNQMDMIWKAIHNKLTSDLFKNHL